MPEENDSQNNNTNEENNQSTQQQPPNTDADKNWRNLETAKSAAEQRAAKLLESTVNTLAEGAGLDTSKGMNKLLVDAYTKSLGVDDVPSKQSFTEFLTSQGYEPGSQQSPQEQNLNTLQSQADRLRNAGQQPGGSKNLKDVISELETNGQWDKALDLKLAAMYRGEY